MARKTRREIHDQYKQRLEFAKNWRDEEGYDRTWRRLNDLYLSLIHISEPTRPY